MSLSEIYSKSQLLGKKKEKKEEIINNDDKNTRIKNILKQYLIINDIINIIMNYMGNDNNINTIYINHHINNLIITNDFNNKLPYKVLGMSAIVDENNNISYLFGGLGKGNA